MKIRILGAFVALSLVAAPATAQHVQYASTVPVVPDWNNEASATGAPGGANCDMTTGPYADNPAGNTRLQATNFQAFTLPSGHQVTRVQVGVMARFDMGEPANIEVRAQWLPDGATQTMTSTMTFGLNNPLGNENCSWHDFDITSAEGWWSQAEVNRIVVGVRRANSYPNNTLRVKGFRVRVDTQACSGALMLLCNGAPNSTAQPARLIANGPLTVSNALQLTVTGAPALSVGFTFVGRSAVWTPSGNGTLCLGSAIRAYPPVQLNHSGAGSFFIPPNHPAFANISLGQQTVLQFVYRDTVGAGFNLTDALYGYPCP